MKIWKRIAEWDALISEPLIHFLHSVIGVVALYVTLGLCAALPFWLIQILTGGNLGVIIEVAFWEGPWLVLGVFLYRFLGRDLGPAEPHECHFCRYDLTAYTTGICPECGMAVKTKRVPPENSDISN